MPTILAVKTTQHALEGLIQRISLTIHELVSMMQGNKTVILIDWNANIINKDIDLIIFLIKN